MELIFNKQFLEINLSAIDRQGILYHIYHLEERSLKYFNNRVKKAKLQNMHLTFTFSIKDNSF